MVTRWPDATARRLSWDHLIELGKTGEPTTATAWKGIPRPPKLAWGCWSSSRSPIAEDMGFQKDPLLCHCFTLAYEPGRYSIFKASTLQEPKTQTIPSVCQTPDQEDRFGHLKLKHWYKSCLNQHENKIKHNWDVIKMQRIDTKYQATPVNRCPKLEYKTFGTSGISEAGKYNATRFKPSRTSTIRGEKKNVFGLNAILSCKSTSWSCGVYY